MYIPSSARRRLIGDSARLLARRSPSRRFGPRRASRRPAATRQRGSGRMRHGRREKIASRASARRFPARRAAARAFAQPAKDSPVPPAICSACRSSSSLLLVPAGQATLLLVPTGGGRRHCSPPPVELVGRSRCSSSTRAAPGIPTGDGARCSSLEWTMNSLEQIWYKNTKLNSENTELRTDQPILRYKKHKMH